MTQPRKMSLARGTRGFLLRSNDSDGSLRYFFRVYGAGHSFRDYELLHSDLEIEIVDEEATLYEREDGLEARLDHSPRTLGQERIASAQSSESTAPLTPSSSPPR